MHPLATPKNDRNLNVRNCPALRQLVDPFDPKNKDYLLISAYVGPDRWRTLDGKFDSGTACWWLIKCITDPLDIAEIENDTFGDAVRFKYIVTSSGKPSYCWTVSDFEKIDIRKIDGVRTGLTVVLLKSRAL